MGTKTEELAFHISKFKKELLTLDEIFEQPFIFIVRDAAIQRFEYCFELA